MARNPTFPVAAGSSDPPRVARVEGGCTAPPRHAEAGDRRRPRDQADRPPGRRCAAGWGTPRPNVAPTTAHAAGLPAVQLLRDSGIARLLTMLRAARSRILVRGAREPSELGASRRLAPPIRRRCARLGSAQCALVRTTGRASFGRRWHSAEADAILHERAAIPRLGSMRVSGPRCWPCFDRGAQRLRAGLHGPPSGGGRLPF